MSSSLRPLLNMPQIMCTHAPHASHATQPSSCSSSFFLFSSSLLRTCSCNTHQAIQTANHHASTHVDKHVSLNKLAQQSVHRKSTAGRLEVLAISTYSCKQMTIESTLMLLARLSSCCRVYPVINAGLTLQHMLSLASSARMDSKVN